MKVLITGITGFVGSHLAELALSKGVEVYGSIRWRSKTENINHIRDELKLIECDLTDLSSVYALIEQSKPDYIFHLAAQSFVPTSWHAPAETLTNNIISEVNIFEAIRHQGIDPMIQIAGSSEEYGLVGEDEIPVREINPLRPLSPYGISKISQDFLGYQYFQSYGLKVIRTRAFNHTGPRRGEVFVISSFAKQIAEIEADLRNPVISVGNLEASRDFTDVRDVVRAYWLALEKCEPGEVYNIASGASRRIKDVLDLLLSLTPVSVEIRQDPAKIRPSDIHILQGDSTKFRRKTGWRPEIPFEKTVKDILDYWREAFRYNDSYMVAYCNGEQKRKEFSLSM